MAYEIDHRPEADYRLYQFNGDNALLERLNQRLRILDGVLRFRIIKLKPGQPTPPPPDQQAPRRREEREAQDTKVAARAAADAPPRTRAGRAPGRVRSRRRPRSRPPPPEPAAELPPSRSPPPGRGRVALARLPDAGVQHPSVTGSRKNPHFSCDFLGGGDRARRTRM